MAEKKKNGGSGKKPRKSSYGAWVSMRIPSNDYTHDWAVFNSDRRYYRRLQDAGTYLEEFAEETAQPEVKSVEDFLDNIENQQLYQILIMVDRLTLQIIVMKIQGYSTHEIASRLNTTEKAVYRRMDRLKEKLKKFFE